MAEQLNVDALLAEAERVRAANAAASAARSCEGVSTDGLKGEENSQQ